MLEIINFEKKYAEKIIFKNLNLKFETGKSVIIGENGSGKTTLLNHIYELYKNEVSYFSQFLVLIPELTVIENIMFLIGFQIENELLLAFKLADKLYRPAAELSSGERQKVILYCTILCSNNIIIVDEPEKHLDKENVKKYFTFIKKSEKNYIIATHEKELALLFFENVFEIQNHDVKQIKKMDFEFNQNPKFLNYKPKKFLKTFIIIDKFYIIFFFLLITALFTIFANVKQNDVTSMQYENDYDTSEVRIDVKTEDSVSINANFTVPDYLIGETYDFLSIDLLGIFNSNDGFFLNDKLNNDIYIYKSSLTLENFFDTNDFGVYVSSDLYYEGNTNITLRINERKIRVESNIYNFSFNANLPIKGIVSNEYSRIYYDYNELYDYINSLMIAGIGSLDYAHENLDVFKDIFIKQRYVALMASQIPIETIGQSEFLNNGLSITNYSLLNSTYLYEYKNNITISLVLLSFSILLSLLGLTALIMFTIFFRKNRIEKYYYAAMINKRHYILTIRVLLVIIALLTSFFLVCAFYNFIIII